MSAPLEALRTALAGRYEIERELGQGGMATVYLARDVKHNRQVALKVLRSDLAELLGPERFLREIEIAANLNHPHILALFDSGSLEGFLYYVMPLVEGETLDDRVARDGALPIADVLRILREVVDALAYAHARGIVHRDIKPSNVMVTGRHIVVADFGIAKAVSDASTSDVALTLTATGTSLGTPAYMSPEQAMGESGIDGRSDIYSVGAMAYELLTGKLPFEGPTAGALIAAQLSGTVRPIKDLRPDVPADLDRLVMRCLEKEAADRWQTAEEVLGYLDEMTPDRITPTKARVVPRQFRVPKIKRNAALVGAALFGATLVVVAAFSLRPTGRSPVVMPSAEQITFSGDVDYVAMASDGRTAAYVQMVGTGEAREDVLHIADVGGAGAGGDQSVAEGGRIGEPAWSPDGATVLFRWRHPAGRDGLYEVPRLGGTPRRLVNTEDWPTAEVAYNYGGDGYLIGAGRWIYQGREPGSIRWPAPDSMAGSGRVLALARVTPSGETQYLRVQALNGAAIARSPNGRWITYHSRGTIRLIASDGSGERGWWGGREMMAGRMSRMVWAAGSDGVYYVLGKEDSPDPVLVRRGVDPESGEVSDLQDTVWTQRAIWRFDLAPEARTLLVAAGWEFKTLRLVGLGEARATVDRDLVTRTADILFPRFSPDGSRLVYSEIIGYGRAAVHALDLEDSTAWQFPVDGVPGGYAWAPDGVRVALLRQGGGGARGQTLWLLDLSTERLDSLDQAAGETDPVWSADGRTLVYFNIRRDTLRLRSFPDGAVRSVPLPARGWDVLYAPGSDRMAVLTEGRVLWVADDAMRFRRYPDVQPLRLLQWREGGLHYVDQEEVWRLDLAGGSPVRVAGLDGCTTHPSDPRVWTLAPDLATGACVSSSVKADLMVVRDFGE